MMIQRYGPRCRTPQEGGRASSENCIFLTRARERMRGLLFREPDARVRVFVPCNAIHTVGMAHELDVAFLDEEGTVLATYRKVGRRRWLRCPAARVTLERFADEAPWFAVGDRVGLESIASNGKEDL